MAGNSTAHKTLWTEDERKLWDEFLVKRSPELRTHLIQHYLGNAKRIAAFLYSKRSVDGVDFDDYLQYARMGLIEAVDRFDPERGASFSTFAGYRIRGAILNGIENCTEINAVAAYRRRATRDRVESAQEALLNDSLGDPFYLMVEIALDLALGYLLEDSGLHGDTDTQKSIDPYHVCELKFIQDRLKLVVEVLPERERMIIKGHYYEHIEFNALAAMLGITKGRVSQLHSRGLKLVREAYRAVGALDVSY
jgi:RNA polymerase sigma factor for flagellar operon FliA